MDALLEFRGREFAVDSALADSPWRGHAKVWHHGEVIVKRSRRVCEDSGFNLRIGGSGAAELEQQIAEVETTLQCAADEVRRIRAVPGIESACVRFGELWRPDQVAAKFSRLPNHLLLLCGRLGLDIVVCQYLSSGDDDESKTTQSSDEPNGVPR